MKTYNIISPSLEGLLIDDELYFEGMRRPREFFILRENVIRKDTIDSDSLDILEKYINDIHNLFLKKLSFFITEESVPVEESLKLQALLQEIVKVKDLIRQAYKTDIIDR